jgi:flagellar protein FliO/FliZ
MQTTSILLAVLSLVVVLGLILAAGRLARVGIPGLSTRQTNAGRMTLVQVLVLDPRRRLHLVCCDGRHVLLLTGGGQDLVVGWLDHPPTTGAAP